MKSLKPLILSIIFVLSAIILRAQLPDTIPSDGIDSYYSFQGNANDLVGGNNGTVTGPTFVNDASNNPNSALLFDGVNDYIQLQEPFLNGTQRDEFSIFVRFKINESGDYGIWTKTKFWGEVNVEVKPDNSVRIVWANNVTGNKYSRGRTDPNSIGVMQWTDVVFTFSNSTIQTYIDGYAVNTDMEWILQGGNVISTTEVEEFCNFAQDPNSSKFGTRIFGGTPQRYFDGIIDEFGIWDRALTETEITELSGIPTSTNTIRVNEFETTVRPNPSDGIIILDVQNINKKFDLTIYNNYGSIVLNQKELMPEGGKYEQQLNLNHLESGVYFIRINHSEGSAIKKVVIQ